MDSRLAAMRDALTGAVIQGAGNVRYHLERCVGEGGQGWVFRASRDEPGGFVVIVKVLRPDAADDDALRRFRREADVLRVLSQQQRPNPHIVRFYDHATTTIRAPGTGEALALPFTVLEYVSGVPLSEVLHESDGRGLPLDRVRRILRQVSEALTIVHGERVIHRDLKPSNILLAVDAGSEIAKVTDFGLARIVEVGPQTTSVLVGVTLGYAPPEQFEKGNPRVSVRTDVFSLAAITFEMLAGRPAFPFGPKDNPLRVVARMMSGPAPSLQRDVPAPSPELAARPDLLEAIDLQLARALSAEPSERHASVDEFLGSVEPFMRVARKEEPAARPMWEEETIPANQPAPTLEELKRKLASKT